MKPIIHQLEQNIFTIFGLGAGASLLRGKFGNYLFGTADPDLADVKALIEAVGGIKYQFPLASSAAYDHLPVRLFKVFGSQLIAMNEKFYTVFCGKLPCFHYKERIFTDLTVDITNQKVLKLGIRFRGRPYRLTEMGVIESLNFLEQIISDLNKYRYVFHYDENTNSIAFFDDIEFERNDYEVISPGVRKNFAQILGKHAFSHLGKGLFSNGVDKVYVSPPPRVLMSGPIDSLKLCPDAAIKIVTPTQMAILILEAENEEKISDLINLARVLPFNLKKLDFYLRNSKNQISSEVRGELTQIQTKCSKFYKANRCKDGIGKKLNMHHGV